MKRMREIYTQRIPAQLKITGGEYRAQWSGTYNYDTPILIDSLSAWKEFFKSHPEQSVKEDILQKNYGRVFFKDSVIYAYVKGERSGLIRLKVKGAELNGDKLRLFMERINPGEGTCDMATRICLFGIKKSNIKNVTVVEAIIADKKDN
jgi:hypothetical protein